MAFVCLVEVRLQVPDSDNLKSKRRVVRSVKDAIRERLGAAVAEIDGQDTWQRSTLLCALVGLNEVDLARRADRLEALVVTRVGETCSFERDIRSLKDLRG
jgi:uncharacterized protein YlxP (DUF503 family)